MLACLGVACLLLLPGIACFSLVARARHRLVFSIAFCAIAGLLIHGLAVLLAADLGAHRPVFTYGLVAALSLVVIYVRRASFRGLRPRWSGIGECLAVGAAIAVALLMLGPPFESGLLHLDDTILISQAGSIARGSTTGRDRLLQSIPGEDMRDTLYHTRDVYVNHIRMEFAGVGYYMNDRTGSVQFQYLDLYPALLAIGINLLPFPGYLTMHTLVSLLFLLLFYLLLRHILRSSLSLLIILLLPANFFLAYFMRYISVEMLFAAVFAFAALLIGKGLRVDNRLMVRLGLVCLGLTAFVHIYGIISLVFFFLSAGCLLLLEHVKTFRAFLRLSAWYFVPFLLAVAQALVFNTYYVLFTFSALISPYALLALCILAFCFFFGLYTIYTEKALFWRMIRFLNGHTVFSQIGLALIVTGGLAFLALHVLALPPPGGKWQNLYMNLGILLQSFNPIGFFLLCLGVGIACVYFPLRLRHMRNHIAFILFAGYFGIFFLLFFAKIPNQALFPWSLRRWVFAILPGLVCSLVFLADRAYRKLAVPRIRGVLLFIILALCCFPFIKDVMRSRELHEPTPFKGVSHFLRSLAFVLPDNSVCLFERQGFIPGAAINLKYLYDKDTLLPYHPIELNYPVYDTLAEMAKQRPVFVANVWDEMFFIDDLILKEYWCRLLRVPVFTFGETAAHPFGHAASIDKTQFRLLQVLDKRYPRHTHAFSYHNYVANCPSMSGSFLTKNQGIYETRYYLMPMAPKHFFGLGDIVVSGEKPVLSFTYYLSEFVWGKPSIGDGAIFEMVVLENGVMHKEFLSYIDPKHFSEHQAKLPAAIDLTAYKGKRVSFVFYLSSMNTAYDWGMIENPCLCDGNKKQGIAISRFFTPMSENMIRPYAKADKTVDYVYIQSSSLNHFTFDRPIVFNADRELKFAFRIATDCYEGECANGTDGTTVLAFVKNESGTYLACAEEFRPQTNPQQRSFSDIRADVSAFKNMENQFFFSVSSENTNHDMTEWRYIRLEPK